MLFAIRADCKMQIVSGCTMYIAVRMDCYVVHTEAICHPCLVFICTLLFLSFCYAPTRPMPLFLVYTPQSTKKTLLMIKYELSTSYCWCFLSWVQLHQQRVVQLLGNAKHCPTHLSEKIPFTNAVKPFYGCQRSALKILGLMYRLRLVLRLWSG